MDKTLCFSSPRPTLYFLLTVALIGLAAAAFGYSEPSPGDRSATFDPSGALTSSEEVKTLAGVDLGSEQVFQVFSRSATTPTSVQFASEIDVAWTNSLTATSTNRVRGAYSASGCFPFDPDAYLGLDGNGYVRARISVDGSDRALHTNWRPVGALGIPGTGAGSNSATLIQNDDEPIYWSDEITDPTLLSFVTGSGTFRVYFQFSYNASDSCTVGGGVAQSASKDISAMGGVRFNY